MLRIRAPFLSALGLLFVALLGMTHPPTGKAADVPPDPILYMDADSIFFLRSLEWQSGYIRHQEKLLHHNVRMKYWRSKLTPDMALVFDTLGYPSGRVMLTPVGHREELWYFGQMNPPLRFVDGALVNQDQFEIYRSRP